MSVVTVVRAGELTNSHIGMVARMVRPTIDGWDGEQVIVSVNHITSGRVLIELEGYNDRDCSSPVVRVDAEIEVNELTVDHILEAGR